MHDRRPATTGWNIWRGIVGVFYLACAVFNAVFTLPRADELDAYAEGAWFDLLEDFMWDVFMPNGEVFMVLIIVFEIAVGMAILSRGRWVDIGVGASVLWVLAVIPFLAFPYLLVNVGLAAAQGSVSMRRYDAALWHRTGPRGE